MSRTSRNTLPAICHSIVLLLLLASGGSMGAEQTSAGATGSAVEDGLDASIQPGNDFYAYANGGWLKDTEIPENKTRWSARDEIDAKTKQQLAALFDERIASPAGSYQRKVADFHAAYLAEDAIEANGIAPLKPLLERIAGVQDKAALTRWLGSDLRADVDPLNYGVYASASLFGLSVERGIHGEKNHFAYLLQGGLGLRDRDVYLDPSAKSQAQRAKYQEHIGHVLGLAGFDRAAQRAEAVMVLETAIARSHATNEESSNEKNADNHWTLTDFSRNAPGLDWPAFFAAAGLEKQRDFVVWQTGAIRGEADLVATHSLDTWKDYLRFHAIDRYADVLPRAFAEQASATHEGGIAGTHDESIREERALEATNRALAEAVGRMYVEKYFPPEAKAKAQAILANVVDAFGKRIESNQWMSPATKKLALSRLKTMYFGVGYPDKWLVDYSGLTIDPGDAIGNLQRVSDWNYRNAIAKLDQPADRTEWIMQPQVVGAVYQPLQNAYNFPAALLQAPKFDPAATDAANYGSIGAIFGHEVSHFVDRLGADYDDSGATQHWWSNEDGLGFDKACAPLVAQYSSYKPFPELALDGKQTLSENVADLGGLSAAFDAYRRTLGSKAHDEAFVRQQDREFFIAFARAWRVKMRPDALRKQATSDHAPENYRISTVRNMSEWYRAFYVLPDQGLYLRQEARVRIW